MWIDFPITSQLIKWVSKSGWVAYGSWVNSTRDPRLNGSDLLITEFLWCTTSRRQHRLPAAGPKIVSSFVERSSSARDLGVFIDSDLSMETHVKRTVSSCFGTLRELRSIRRQVPNAVFQSLVVGLVLSRLDYCNGVLIGLPAASPVGSKRCSTVDLWNPPLRTLRWLEKENLFRFLQ